MMQINAEPERCPDGKNANLCAVPMRSDLLQGRPDLLLYCRVQLKFRDFLTFTQLKFIKNTAAVWLKKTQVNKNK